MGSEPAACALEIQGHRGARGLSPENTLPGFETALSIGVHTLELDVGMSRDGVVVVHHDSTLNPDTTRDARGHWLDPGHRPPLWELPFSELKMLDVGGLRPGTGYARRFSSQIPSPGARIPTLSEVARLLRSPGAEAVCLNVEVKISPDAPALTAPPAVLAEAVVKVLRNEGLADRATIQSFDWRVPGRVQEVAPEIATGYLSARRPRENTVESRWGVASPWTAGLRPEDFDGSVPDMAHAAGGRVWAPNHRDVSQEQLDRAHALGLRVAAWTVNSPRDIRRLIRMGVDSIISDYPDRARKAAESLRFTLPPRVSPAR